MSDRNQSGINGFTHLHRIVLDAVALEVHAEGQHLAGHRTDVGAAVTTDFGLVPHATQ
jgi:hypothetical protein